MGKMVDVTMNKGKIQFVWYCNPKGWGLGYAKLGIRRSCMGYVYRWILCIGPLDIRRWETRTLDEVREANERGYRFVLWPLPNRKVRK